METGTGNVEISALTLGQRNYDRHMLHCDALFPNDKGITRRLTHEDTTMLDVQEIELPGCVHWQAGLSQHMNESMCQNCMSCETCCMCWYCEACNESHPAVMPACPQCTSDHADCSYCDKCEDCCACKLCVLCGEKVLSYACNACETCADCCESDCCEDSANIE